MKIVQRLKPWFKKHGAKALFGFVAWQILKISVIVLVGKDILLWLGK